MRARFADMGDEELRRVVTVDREEYVPRALELAEAEVAKRRATGATSAEAPHAGERSPAPAGHLWVDLYAALLAVGAIGNVVAAIVTGASLGMLLLLGAFACVAAPLAYGLRLRSPWAWTLNWAFMVVYSVGAIAAGRGAIPVLVWVVVNAVYFARRSALFWGKVPRSS